MENKRRLIIICGGIGLLFVVLLVVIVNLDSSGLKIGFVENNLGNSASASFRYYDGSKVKKVNFEKDKNIVITYSIKEKSGNISIAVYDEDGNLVEKKEGTGNGEIRFLVEKTQKYSIRMEAQKANGNYKFSWSEE